MKSAPPSLSKGARDSNLATHYIFKGHLLNRPARCFVLILMSFRSTTRDWVGEHGVSALRAGSLDRDLYTRFDDIIVPSTNGTTQIDHIVVSAFGVFVI